MPLDPPSSAVKFPWFLSSVLIDLRRSLLDALPWLTGLWMCQAWARTPNLSNPRRAWLRSRDCRRGLLSRTSPSYRVEKFFLPLHQGIASDLFEIHKMFKMLNKGTFIFKLYSPQVCLWNRLSEHIQCRVKPHSGRGCSAIPQGTRRHVFSTSNWIFLVIGAFHREEIHSSAQIFVHQFILSKGYSKGTGLCLAMNKTAPLHLVIWIILAAKQSQRKQSCINFGYTVTPRRAGHRSDPSLSDD